MDDVTRILGEIERGDAAAAARLLPLVYDELRRLAAQRLAREKPGQTLQATALVHEAYLRLVGSPQASLKASLQRKLGVVQSLTQPPPAYAGGSPEFASRAYFFAAAAEAMRRILV